MPARVLVAYASKLGSTREIATVVGEVIRDAGYPVEVLAASDVTDVARYDAVVLGSALYAAHWQREANRFVAHHLAALRERPVWLFSSGPLDARLATADVPISPHVAEITDPVGARAHRTFGGRLEADAPGIDPRILATHQVGDFRDWDAIRAWAAGVARELSDLERAG